jgi:phenylalanyl-tRNA synthetase beta chain
VRIGEFPGTRREINAVIARERAATDVVDAVKSFPQCSNELVEAVEMVSVYEGAGVPDGHKAVLVRVSFRSPDRTPTDVEVNTLQDGIRQSLAAVAGVTLK